MNLSNHRLWITAAAVLLMLPLLAGCQNKQVNPVTAGIDPIPAEEFPQIVLDPKLRGWIVADVPRVSREPTMNVNVRARSVSAQDTMHVEYRFTFLLPDGTPTDHKPATWRRMAMRPGAEVVFNGRAMDERASEWRLEIR